MNAELLFLYNNNFSIILLPNKVKIASVFLFVIWIVWTFWFIFSGDDFSSLQIYENYGSVAS